MILIGEYTNIASQLADDYYHRVRQSWANHAGVSFRHSNDTGSLTSTGYYGP